MRKRTIVGVGKLGVAARVAAMGALLAVTLAAQDSDQIKVPFRDPAGPKKVTINLINGSINVRGYEGREVLVESRGSGGRKSRPSNVPEGMHEIGPGRAGLEISEESNTVKIDGGIMQPANVTVQVPMQTSLVLRTVNGGHIEVENVAGEIDAQNMNGSVTITNVSGSVVANSQNGKVIVSLNRVTPGKAMSFISFNGTVDVTLPADTKANLKMRTDNGSIWSDFDVKLDNSSRAPQVEDNRRSGGKYRIKMDHTMYGTINGGGPEMSLVTYNGNIVIHKK